jgi:hypothetical protein
VTRPFSALAALGTAAHHAFEVRAGVGLVFEPFLGRGGAVALWSLALPGYVLGALSGRTAKLVALSNGMSLAGGAVHYVLWPWELRGGVPTLTAAEGMTGDRLGAYNRVLQAWTLAAALALVTETPRDGRRWAALGLLTVEPLRRSAVHHFRWAREQALREPERWSPVLRAL